MGDMSELEHVYGFQNTLYILKVVLCTCVCCGLVLFCLLFSFLSFLFLCSSVVFYAHIIIHVHVHVHVYICTHTCV